MASKRSGIFSLAFVLFIDALGLAIMFPIFNPLFLDPNGLLPAATSLSTRHFYYGVTLTLFPIAMFFSAPVLGDISDKIGRKKVLAIALVGAFFGYVLSALAVPLKSVMLLLIGRFIAGLTAGSQPIAQAAIVDISHPKEKAHNLSIIIAAMSLGWIGGPLLGGYLTDSNVVSWFSPAVALSCAALLSLANFFVLQIFFKETLKTKQKLARLHLHKGPVEFVLAFKLRKIRALSCIYLLLQIGWGFYFSFVSLFLNGLLNLSAHDIGLFLAFIALGFMTPSFGMLKQALRHLAIENAAASALGLGGVIFLLTNLTTHHPYALWPLAFLVGLSIGVAFSYLLALFSNQVSVKEQGRIMGVTTAIAAVGWALASFIGGFLANISLQTPLIVAGILLILASALTYLHTQKE